MFTIAEIFKMQNILNERVGFDAKHFAEVFSQNPNSVDKQQSKIEAGRWIDDFLKAMASEMEELRNCSFWKHWCSEAQEGRRYEVKDVEAARKEVIDMFHFWINLAQALGMTPEMVCGMYASKLAANIKRQDDGYSIEVKDNAWALFLEHPDQNPVLGSLAGESLEDLSSEAQTYYMSWAKYLLDPIHSRVDCCTFPTLQHDGCRLCGKQCCEQRAIEDMYCDCLDTKFNNGPKEDTASILPQPDPDCKKCGGTGYEN